MCICNFTFIIPHKNIPDLLQRCIDSIPKREDVHIVVVDDNSDPSLVDFEQFPGLNNPFVEVVFTKEGKGAGYARNIGLRQVQSKWVLFADADDFFTSELNVFLDKYKDSSADVVFITNNTIDSDTYVPQNQDLKVIELIKECNTENSFDALRYKAQPPWTKMVKMSLINQHHIMFDETPASNDVWYSIQVGFYAREIEISEEIVYTRTIRQGSLQYSLNQERLLSRLKVGYKVNTFLKKHGKIKYYNETWGYLLNLRKISYPLFFMQLFKFIYKTPFFIINKHIKYNFQRLLK